MARRKTKGDKWEHEVCRACESSLQPKKNGHTRTKCQTWACSAACGRAVENMVLCRMETFYPMSQTFLHHSDARPVPWSDARSKKKKTVGNEKCGACESSFQVQQMPRMGMLRSLCKRRAADFHLCQMTGVAAHERQSCAEGTQSQAARGTPRLTAAND